MREYVAIVVLDLNLTTWLLAHAVGALPHLGAEDDSIEPLLVPFDTYTAFNPALVQVLHKPNFHWSKTMHAISLSSMSKAEAETELAGLKMHAEGKSDEAAASKYFSRGPYLRQFIEELDSVNEDAQASQGDIGLTKFVAATVACNKDILSRVGSTNRYSTCMEQMEMCSLTTPT